MSKYVKFPRRAAGARGSQRAQEVHLMRSPVSLSPVQPCLTRAKTCCLIHSCQGKRRRRCGETEEVWKDRGGKGGGGGGGRWMTGSENGKAKKRTFALTFFFTALRTWEVCGGTKSHWDSRSGQRKGRGRGRGRGIHFLWGATKPESNHCNYTLKETTRANEELRTERIAFKDLEWWKSCFHSIIARWLSSE